MKSAHITKLLVANRGEIARRIMRSARKLGISTAAVYSDEDRHSPFALEADEAVRIGPPPAAESYLSIPKLIDAAKRVGAQAIHPGYGFLAENAAFSKAVDEAGLVFVGPSAESISAMGSKIESKRITEKSGVPVIPGYSPKSGEGVAELKKAALSIGFPILIKASAGGGGKGMRIVREEKDLDAALESCKREAEKSFGDGTLLLEKYFDRARHVEFQVFGDLHGNSVHIFERECSIQRRHQKIIEETPSTAVDEELRRRMGEAAVAAAKSIGYHSAGTVEFILDANKKFYFLEMNTRLQVEHPVTEMTTGLDLVEWQLRIAMGEKLPMTQEEIYAARAKVGGVAIECRIYAEDPENGFLPATGKILKWQPGSETSIRYDAGVENGSVVGTHYDPMLAKVIAHGTTRKEAAYKMSTALKQLVIHGVKNNVGFLRRILETPEYINGDIDTQLLDRREDLLASEKIADKAIDEYAAAASIWRHVRRNAGSDSLPGSPTGFRNVRWRDQDDTYDCHAGKRTIFYRDLGKGRYTITVNGVSTLAEIVRASEPDCMRIEIDGMQRDYVLSGNPQAEYGRIFVHGSEGSIVFEALPRFPDKDLEHAVPGGCMAPMPGTIVKTFIKEGDVVKKHDPLVVMEAMKMEHTVYADIDGTVKELSVKPGDTVDAGHLLVVLEEKKSTNGE